MPVDLVSFTGRRSGDHTLLEWTAANERQFSHYEIERSESGTTTGSRWTNPWHEARTDSRE